MWVSKLNWILRQLAMSSSPYPRAITREVLGGVGSKNADWISVAALVLLFASNILDPGGTIGLKYLGFFVATLISVRTVQSFFMPSRAIVLGVLLFLVWPTWSLLYGAASGGDLRVGVSQVTPFLFALILALILPAFDAETPSRLFYGCFLVLAAVIIIAFTLILLMPENPVSQRLFAGLTELQGQEGYFGMRSLGENNVPNIYFGSSLFLVPAFIYFFFSGRTVRAAVILVALSMTFSKAGVVIAIAFGLGQSIACLFSSGGIRKALPLALIIITACLLIWELPDFTGDIHDAITGESYTAEVRRDHVKSLIRLFEQHAHYLVLGQGVGVPFFSTGESAEVQNIELDHLNTVRKFGLPWFIGFSAVVFYSARRLIKTGQREQRAFGFALLGMYLAAGTNPVLTGPLFIMLMTLAYFAQRRGSESESKHTFGYV